MVFAMARSGVSVDERIEKLRSVLKEQGSKIKILGDSGYRSFTWIVYDCQCTNCDSILLVTDKVLKTITHCGCLGDKKNGIFKIKVSEGE